MFWSRPWVYWDSQVVPPVNARPRQAFVAADLLEEPVASQAGRPFCQLPVMIFHWAGDE